MQPRSWSKRLLTGLLLCSLGLAAWGQSWPTKPVRLVLQFPPGGSTDAVARILGEDRPMRFTSVEKKGFFSKMFGG